MMSERPMSAGEAEAMFDRAVDALCAEYGKPMAAAILEGRARLMTKEVNDSLGWSPAVQKAMARFQDRSSLRGMREALERIARPRDCGCVPCRGQCTSREALLIEAEAMRDIADAALAALSEQARGQGRSESTD